MPKYENHRRISVLVSPETLKKLLIRSKEQHRHPSQELSVMIETFFAVETNAVALATNPVALATNPVEVETNPVALATNAVVPATNAVALATNPVPKKVGMLDKGYIRPL